MEVTKQTARRNHASLGQESATVSDVSTSIQSTETVDFAGRPSPKPLALGVQCEARGWLKWRTESGLKRQNEVRHNRVRKERAHKHTHTHTHLPHLPLQFGPQLEGLDQASKMNSKAFMDLAIFNHLAKT